jgi:thiol-disulfide isomerase/thioredoxin
MDGDDDGATGRWRSRRQVLAATAGAGGGLLAGCLGGGGDPGGDGNDGSDRDSMEDGSDGDGMDDGSSTSTDDGTMDDGSMDDGSGGDASSWRTVELSTVRDEETFTVEGLEGPVVVQSFAVWCPKCQRQSGELANVGDAATVVSLNTDPNEDAAKVRQHAEDNGFDWRFAVAPSEMTKSLIDEFGSTVTNAPSTPVIVACEDGGTEFFSGSIQSAGEIESAAGNC